MRSDAVHSGTLPTLNNTRTQGEGSMANGSTAEPISGAQETFSISSLGLKGLLRYGGSCKVLVGVVNGAEAAIKVYNRTPAAKDEMCLELRAYGSLGGFRVSFSQEG